MADIRRKADSCTCQWWNTDRAKACPCVCVRRSVSKPKESIAGMKALIVYRGDPGIGASWVTWPLIDDKQRTNFLKLKVSLFQRQMVGMSVHSISSRVDIWRWVHQPSSSQYCVDSRHAISRSLNLHKVIRLHQPWSGLWHRRARILKREQKSGDTVRLDNVKLTCGFMIRAVKEPKWKREEAKIVKEECYRATIKRNTCQQNPKPQSR